MILAQSGSTEEVLAAFFYGREDIIPEMFSRLQKTLAGARGDKASLRHFIYYIERHIELDGDSHGPMGQELLEGLVAGSPEKVNGRSAPRAAASKPGSELWNGTLSYHFASGVRREGHARNLNRGTTDNPGATGAVDIPPTRFWCFPPKYHCLRVYGMARPSFRRPMLAGVSRGGRAMAKISVLGVDLGKNVCSVVGLGASGAVVMRRRDETRTR